MIRLLLVSLVWAFSFGIVKHGLAGVDASFLSFARLLLAFLVFAPFLGSARLRGGAGVPVLRLLGLGALQYGLMYLLYIHSFAHLKAYQIAFFTIFTPLWVTLIDDLLERRFRAPFLAAAALAVLGTGIVTYRDLGSGGLQTGFWLMQGSNLCFAAGQVLYRRWRVPRGTSERDVFGWLYLGAVALTLVPAGQATGWSLPVLGGTQAAALLYLGPVASGLGFFLWNRGAREVNAGTLAVMNNLKVPLGVLVSVAVFGESVEPVRLTLGLGVVIGAVLLNERFHVRGGKRR
jgi:drug/metabolite transporter (DMT)-like permease